MFEGEIKEIVESQKKQSEQRHDLSPSEQRMKQKILKTINKIIILDMAERGFKYN